MKKDLKLSSIKVIGLVLGFALQVYFTKVIGVKEYGLYVLFTTWTNFLSLVLILGYDRVIIKQLGYFYIQRIKGKFRSTLDKLMIFVLLNSLIFLLIAFFIPQKFLTNSFFSKDLLRSSWLLIAAGTVTFTLFDLLGKILSAIQRVELTILRSEVIYKFILFITVIVFFFYFKTIAGINLIVVGVIFAHITTLLIFTFIVDRKKMQQYFAIKKEKISLGKENYVFFFTGLNYYAINQIDKLFLGKYESLETLGVYGLVTTLIGIMSFSTIVYQRFLPKISNYFRTNNIKGLEEDFKTTCRNSLMIALPFMMFILVYTNDILLFFGEKYASGATILRVLIWGQMMNFLTGPCGNLLVHGKYSKIDFANSMIIVALTIVLVIVGYRYYGVVGVAAATSFGMMLINIVKVIEVKIFYKIFPYEIKNIILTLIVFFSFYFIKMIHINIQSLVPRLFTNFSLSLLTALLAIAILYVLQRKKYSYKTMLLNFYDSRRAKQS
ncbi:MAG TPA: oligosaccharide flippase family protein [Chitinophagaceae bacterium]|nr:oligosaccharide flippase family protein [Chitinophagaceae bacterium]